MQARKRISLLVLPVAIAMPGVAAYAADDSQSQPLMEQTAATATAPAASADGAAAATPATAATVSPAAQPDSFGVAMTPDQLSEQRGGDALVGQNNLTGTVSDNTAYKVQTGSNAVTAGSFAGSSGLPTVIQNTGANVLIQNATVLNVRFGD
jgi:hypothetical protein